MLLCAGFSSRRLVCSIIWACIANTMWFVHKVQPTEVSRTSFHEEKCQWNTTIRSANGSLVPSLCVNSSRVQDDLLIWWTKTVHCSAGVQLTHACLVLMTFLKGILWQLLSSRDQHNHSSIVLTPSPHPLRIPMTASHNRQVQTFLYATCVCVCVCVCVI